MKFTKLSPLTGELVREYDYANPGEVDQALMQLHLCFQIWKDLTPFERQQKLKPILVRLKEKKEIFARTISNEMGKIDPEALAEVEKCIKTIDGCLQMNLSFLNPTKTQSVYTESEISFEPLGVIYSIMPWNFPLWQATRMILPGLLAGNVILLKHSEVTPEMGELIEELFTGIFEMPLLLHRLASQEQTEAILADDRVQGVSLTGSTAAGLKISNLAAKYFKKSVLELGGSDPYIVFQDADLALSAKMIAKSRLQNTGQSCIAAKRCLVDVKVLADFMALLKTEFSKYQIGKDLSCLADVRFKFGLQEQLKKLIKNTEAELVFDGPHLQSEKSAYVNSQIYLLSKNSDWLKDQEFFAPVLLVIPFQSVEEALQIANSTIYGLGGAVFSKDLSYAKKQARALEAGQVAINDFIKSDLNLPFGGVKMSGMGRELSQNGFIEFTEMKVVSYQ